VGLGTGDPELITVKAKRILFQVPLIFAPRSHEHDLSFAHSILHSLDGQLSAKVVELDFPMQKDTSSLIPYREKAVQEIWDHLSQGEDCAFVNEGDPFFYGTFIHVFETLRRLHPEVRVEVIPGISSLHAASACTLIPLAHGDEKVAVITSVLPEEILREVLKKFDIVIILKLSSFWDRVLNILGELDLMSKCTYVERSTMREERIIQDITKVKDVDYFSLLIMKK
jgi:precorrin-2/cobalt-factor-2 C20-methyltransferase